MPLSYRQTLLWWKGLLAIITLGFTVTQFWLLVKAYAYEMAYFALEEQIESDMDTFVFVSVIGGSTSITSFLP
jgi:hypothetical protein